MIQVVVTLIASLLCLCAFIFLFVRRADLSTRAGQRSDLHVTGLNGVHFPDIDILSGYNDYRLLVKRSELKSVSAKFREDRRRIVLMWLKELQRDVRVLWEFRRFLVKNGLAVTFREELAIGTTAFITLMELRVLRLLVLTFGPYIPRHALRRVRLPIRQLSGQSVAILSRAPSQTRERVEELWAKYLLVGGMG